MSSAQFQSQTGSIRRLSLKTQRIITDAFQSQTGSIRRNPYGNSLVEPALWFQSQTGSIRSQDHRGWYQSIGIRFNPKLVRLEAKTKIIPEKRTASFNPKLVRLEAKTKIIPEKRTASFNPKLVRLEAI